MSAVQRLKGLHEQFGYFMPALLVFMASYLLLPTSKMVNNVYYALLALPALGVLLVRLGRDVRWSSDLLLWGALCAWYIVVGVLSADGQYFKHVLYVALFVLLVSQLVDPRALRTTLFARGLFWVLGFYVLGSAIVYWLIGRYAPGDRVLWLPGRMTGPIYTSMWLVCCLALAFPGWISERRWLEAASGFLLVIFCIGYVLQSRSGLVGIAFLLLLFCGYVLIRRLNHGGLWGGVLWGGVLLGVLLVLVALAIEIPEISRLFRRADAGRLEIWSKLVSEWLGCGAWLGCGIDYETLATYKRGRAIQHPHNIYLALVLYSGLVSLLIFLGLMMVVLHRAWQRRDPWGLYLLVALVVLNFDGSKLVGNPDELWLLVLLPAALIGNRRGSASRDGA